MSTGDHGSINDLALLQQFLEGVRKDNQAKIKANSTASQAEDKKKKTEANLREKEAKKDSESLTTNAKSKSIKP